MKAAFAAASATFTILLALAAPTAAAHRMKCNMMKGMRCPATMKPTKNPTKVPPHFPTKPPTGRTSKAPTTRAPVGATFCPDIPQAMTGYNGHLYAVITTTGEMTWPVADAAFKAMTCCGATGHLVTIADAGENAFAGALLGTVPSPSPQHAWIGLGDTATEGSLVWTTGEAYDPTALVFDVENPNSPTNDYAFIYYSSAQSATLTLMTPTVSSMLGMIEFDCNAA